MVIDIIVLLFRFLGMVILGTNYHMGWGKHIRINKGCNACLSIKEPIVWIPYGYQIYKIKSTRANEIMGKNVHSHDPNCIRRICKEYTEIEQILSTNHNIMMYFLRHLVPCLKLIIWAFMNWSNISSRLCWRAI